MQHELHAVDDERRRRQPEESGYRIDRRIRRAELRDDGDE